MNTLGKGLESLIPPQGGHNKKNSLSQDGHADADDVSDDNSSSVLADLPLGKNNVEYAIKPTFLESEHEDDHAVVSAGDDDTLRHTSQRQHSAIVPQRRKHKEDLAIFYIEIDKIIPNREQPRRRFDEQAIKELASSIREFGILQPLVVRKIEHDVPTGTQIEYELIAGERRLLAAQMLGLERVPAIIKNIELERERLEIAVIENIQREDLNAIEMARAFARLQDEFRMTQREIASRLGKSRETIANTIRLLDLPEDVRRALEEGKISESHGRLLLTIDNPGLQMELFHDIMTTPMTTRELRNRMRTAVRAEKKLEGESGPIPPEGLPPELFMLQEQLSSDLGAPVKIQKNGDSGKITISFYSHEELAHIMHRLAREGEGGEKINEERPFS